MQAGAGFLKRGGFVAACFKTHVFFYLNQPDSKLWEMDSRKCWKLAILLLSWRRKKIRLTIVEQQHDELSLLAGKGGCVDPLTFLEPAPLPTCRWVTTSSTSFLKAPLDTWNWNLFLMLVNRCLDNINANRYYLLIRLFLFKLCKWEKDSQTWKW